LSRFSEKLRATVAIPLGKFFQNSRTFFSRSLALSAPRYRYQSRKILFFLFVQGSVAGRRSVMLQQDVIAKSSSRMVPTGRDVNLAVAQGHEESREGFLAHILGRLGDFRREPNLILISALKYAEKFSCCESLRTVSG